MPRVLVIGKNGQLGRALASVPDWGLELVFADRAMADLTQPDHLARALNIHDSDLVVNAAAFTQVDQAEKQPDLALAVNGKGVGDLAQLCAQANLPLIHISTDYVFNGQKQTAYTEADPVSPLGVYGRSKLAGEDAIRTHCAQHLILRTSWLHSPWGHNFVRTMMRLAADRDEISVVADQFGSPTFAPHLANTILHLASVVLAPAQGEIWGTYHASDSGQTSWAGLAREIFQVSDELGGPTAIVHDIPSSQYPTPAKRPANSVLDGHKLDRICTPQPQWQAGVRKCVTQLLK